MGGLPVKARIEVGEMALDLTDWRSGTARVLLECVSPFGPANEITRQFDLERS